MIYIFFYQLFVVWLAWDNTKRILENLKIIHWLNGLLHIAASVAIGFSTEWNYGVANLFFTRVFFDSSLNLFRGLPLGYISPDPKSIVDKIEKWIVLKMAEMLSVDPNEAVLDMVVVLRVFIFIKAVILLCI